MQIRLELLDPNLENATVISNWLADPLTNRFLEVRFSVPDPEEQLMLMNDWNSNESTLYFGILVVGKDKPKLIGTVKFGPYDVNHKRGELGILIGDLNYWGKGIASTAIELATKEISRFFPDIRKIYAGAYSENIGSVKAFLKCGFQIEGIQQDMFQAGLQRSSQILLGKSFRFPE
jgi:RimJ/RimL family protein N-acetyltransferase